MEDKQDIEIKERLERIEKQLKINQICLFVLLGWVVLVTNPIGASLGIFVGNIVMVVFLVAISFAILWGVQYYQDWKRGKEMQESSKKPSGTDAG